MGAIEFLGLAITLLAGALTFLGWRNGRWMKQSHQETLQILARMENGQAEARKEANALLNKMDNTLNKMDETLKEIKRGSDEVLKEIATLIVSESEKTRETVKSYFIR